MNCFKRRRKRRRRRNLSNNNLRRKPLRRRNQNQSKKKMRKKMTLLSQPSLWTRMLIFQRGEAFCLINLIPSVKSRISFFSSCAANSTWMLLRRSISIKILSLKLSRTFGRTLIRRVGVYGRQTKCMLMS